VQRNFAVLRSEQTTPTKTPNGDTPTKTISQIFGTPDKLWSIVPQQTNRSSTIAGTAGKQSNASMLQTGNEPQKPAETIVCDTSDQTSTANRSPKLCNSTLKVRIAEFGPGLTTDNRRALRLNETKHYTST
jgi:hypothetical protein